jgi:hypothetical protein
MSSPRRFGIPGKCLFRCPLLNSPYVVLFVVRGEPGPRGESGGLLIWSKNNSPLMILPKF